LRLTRVPRPPDSNDPHTFSPLGHPPAEITSHGARCHDRDPHLALSASKTFICSKTSTLEVSGCQIGSFTSDGHTCRFTSIATELMHRDESSRSAIPAVWSLPLTGAVASFHLVG